MARGWKDWVRGLAIWGVGPDEELRLIRTNEEGYLQVVQVPHAVTHQDGGSDEINVEGLSGVLRDLQRGKFSFVGNWDDFPDPGEEDRLAFAVDRLTIYRDTGTSWQKVATAHWDYIEGQPSEYFPAPHAATHEEGGEDALTPANIGANWNKLVNKPSAFPPSSHAASHQDGGADEINVNGLKGELADYQKTTWVKVDGKPSAFPPSSHAASHENGGADEINVQGLSGELADYQKTTWAKVDGKPSCFTPCAHKSTHQPGGSDALPTAAPAPITEGATGGEGSSTAFAKADHVHETPSEWTPKEHGNEAHSPEMLEKTGDTMEGPLDMGWNVLKNFYAFPGKKHLYSLDFARDNLAFADKRYTVTISPEDAIYKGSIANLFDGRPGYHAYIAEDKLPVVITIEFPLANYMRAVGWMSNESYGPSSFKIEAYDNSAGTWKTLYDTTAWDDPYCAFIEYSDFQEPARNNITKLRFTFREVYGTKPEIQISELYALFEAEAPDPYNLHRSGGDMYGDINMNGNDIVNPGLVDGVDVSSHAARHENGGADEINVNGLSGQLADYQKTTWNLVYNKPSTFPPSAHRSTHEPGASDEVRPAKWVNVTVWGPGEVPPSSWTNLDLSSHIGSRRAIVLLKVHHHGVYEKYWVFRPSDETDDIVAEKAHGGCSGTTVGGGSADLCGYVWVPTGPTGVVQFKSNGGDVYDYVKLLAYIPCS